MSKYGNYSKFPLCPRGIEIYWKGMKWAGSDLPFFWSWWLCYNLFESSLSFWVVLYKSIQFLWIHLQGPELLTADSMSPVKAADDAWHHGMCVACSDKTDLWQGEWRCIRRWIKDDQGIWRLQRHHFELILRDPLNGLDLEFEYPITTNQSCWGKHGLTKQHHSQQRLCRASSMRPNRSWSCCRCCSCCLFWPDLKAVVLVLDLHIKVLPRLGVQLRWHQWHAVEPDFHLWCSARLLDFEVFIMVKGSQLKVGRTSSQRLQAIWVRAKHF